MVLLHALGEQRTSWTEVVRRLCERFRVFSVDLRGHGESDWPGVYSFQLMCDDVLDALDGRALDHVTLVGHSMGGIVCYLAALQQPSRIDRLIIEDIPPPYERDRPIPARPPRVHGFDWAVVPAIVSEVNAGDPQTWARLTTLAAPTLLIGGGPNSHIPQDRLRDVAALIPNCTRVTIPAGHNVHATCPTDFADAIFDWLGSLLLD
jgi:pimeloyl-ACP methyl ester carboxylesterase